jgi:hypothetical protein
MTSDRTCNVKYTAIRVYSKRLTKLQNSEKPIREIRAILSELLKQRFFTLTDQSRVRIVETLQLWLLRQRLKIFLRSINQPLGFSMTSQHEETKLVLGLNNREKLTISKLVVKLQEVESMCIKQEE